MSLISESTTTTHLVIQGRIQSIIPDSDLSRIQSVIKFCQACQSCLVKISSKCTSLLLVKESFCLAPGICTCCCVCSTNYSDAAFRFQLPLRNLYKPLIWVSCFHQVLPLYLDFLNIVFNTIVIAHLTFPPTIDEQLHRTLVFFFFNKKTLLLYNLLCTISFTRFKGRDQWYLTKHYLTSKSSLVPLLYQSASLTPSPNNQWATFFHCSLDL